MSRTFDKADAAVHVELPADLLNAAREGDEHATSAAAKDLVRNIFKQTASLLASAAKRKGLELVEPLAISFFDDNGAPFTGKGDLLFALVKDRFGRSAC